MNALDMPRKNAGYRLDERCIEALKVLAERTGKSINEYLENLVFTHAQIQGVIPPDEKPLGETRGGKRQGTGRKPKIESSLTENDSDVEE
jgi:hypothetical protein